MEKRGNIAFTILFAVFTLSLLVIAMLSLRTGTQTAVPTIFITGTSNFSEPLSTQKESYPYPISTPADPTPSTKAETQPPLLVLPDIGKYPPAGPFQHLRILYGRTDNPGIYSSDLDGLDETQIQPTWAKEIPGGGGENHFLVAPDGSKLLVSSWNNVEAESPLENSIWICNPDGSGLQLLVSAEGDGVPQDPIWSPDSSRVAYRIVRYKDLSPYQIEFWVMEIHNRESELILSSPANGVGSYNIETWGGQAHFFRWMLNKYIYFGTRDEKLISLNPDNKEIYEFAIHQQPINLINAISPDGLQVAGKMNLSENEWSRAGIRFIEVSEQVLDWSEDGRLFLTANTYFTGFTIFDTETWTGKFFGTTTEFNVVSISPDNQYVAYQTSSGLYIMDLKTRISSLIVQNSSDDKSHSSVFFYGWLPIK